MVIYDGGSFESSGVLSAAVFSYFVLFHSREREREEFWIRTDRMFNTPEAGRRERGGSEAPKLGSSGCVPLPVGARESTVGERRMRLVYSRSLWASSAGGGGGSSAHPVASGAL
jgi:hypothetical protein